MSEVMQLSPLSQAAETWFRALGEPSGLLEQRAQALTAYAALPVPKYEKSDLRKRKLDAFMAAPEGEPGAQWRTLAEPYMDDESNAPLLVFADGDLVIARGLASLEEQGVQFLPLRDAICAYPTEVLSRLHTAVPYTENQLLALGAGLWRAGVYVRTPQGVVCEHPLHVLHVATQGGQGAFVHNLIVAEAMSQVTVLETYLASADLTDNLHVGVTEVFVGAGARVKDGIVQDLPRSVTHIVVRRALVERDATMEWVLGELGDGYSVSEVGSRLIGQGSRSTSHAVALGSGRAHADMTARMVHEAKFSESDTTARGVMQGKANGVYRGITHILKGAGGSNGQQSEKLLMMSPGSRADAIPMLLIDENDVKCGHAASVGQINEEQLFYLMSRGISEIEAKRMVVWGFLDPVLAELPLASIRKTVERVLERKMK